MNPMRKLLRRRAPHRLAVAALGLAMIATMALAAGSLAAGEGPVTVRVGTLELTANGGFTPKALSKTAPTPIELSAEGEIKESDGSHPPAVREVIVEGDKNAVVNVKGLPVCTSGQLQATDTSAALAACKSALIGEGTTTAQVAFAEQKPIDVPSKLLVFNGGEKGGKTTFYIHAYFSNPISGAIVTTVTVQKKSNGRFGLYTVAKIPQITGGSGSIISFALKIKKGIKYKGKTYNPLAAKCTDGKLKVHILGEFEDGTKAETEIVRACTPKG
jgi:hypothetical protein